MPRGVVAVLLLAFTFSFTLLLGGCVSLGQAATESGNPSDKLKSSDPISLAIWILWHTYSWKKEYRESLILVWSGFACALIVLIIELIY
jgi:hypothetical protein